MNLTSIWNRLILTYRRPKCGRVLGERARNLGGNIGRVEVFDRDGGGSHHRVTITREHDRFCVFLDPVLLTNSEFVWVPVSRLPTLLMLFSRARHSLKAIEADLSDGEHSGPGVISFCSSHPDAILVPDPHFYHSDGYRQFRHPGFEPAENWWQRSDTVLWRGSTTGPGAISTAAMHPENLTPRVQMCLLLRGVPGTDAKIVGIAQSAQDALDRERLAAAGILAQRINPIAWVGCRYAIDIDGNTNAWSNLFIRLLTGNCVIKVASLGHYRQWFYDRLKPGVHFVPVQSDMSDLVEAIEWCRGHQDECFKIACAGRAFALSMTVEGETAAALERLNAMAGSPGQTKRLRADPKSS
jgi:Glycosyl transferase family 90